jgi:hypothetical protein
MSEKTSTKSHVKEVKSEKKAETKTSRTKIGIRLVETKFGKRILIEQGQNRVWLREADVVQLLTLLAREVLGAKEEEKAEAQ